MRSLSEDLGYVRTQPEEEKTLLHAIFNSKQVRGSREEVNKRTQASEIDRSISPDFTRIASMPKQQRKQLNKKENLVIEVDNLQNSFEDKVSLEEVI